MRERSGISGVVCGQRVAYVIATWGGRRCQRDFDHVGVLRGHFGQIDRLSHGADVILALPHNEGGNVEGFDALIAEIETRDDTEVFRRRNIGGPYGSYSDVYRKYRGYYDVYILVEDDYYPAINDFDAAWVEMLREADDCVGFICGRVGTARAGPHASIAIFAFRTRVLRAVWARYGSLPHFRGTCPRWRPEWRTEQIAFSRAASYCGYRIQDVTRYGYKAPYWYSRFGFVHCKDRNPGGKFLFFPAQKFSEIERYRWLDAHTS